MTKNNILITFAVPCYNVATYVDHCVETILDGTKGYHERIEIILVDDGSTKDETAQHIDSWAREHPSIIKAIHQENGGHGEAVNTGLRNASGYYFKVVDADDWLDEAATQEVLACIASFVDEKLAPATENNLHRQEVDEPVDLIVTNYVYEKVFEGKQQPVRYKKALPEGLVVDWSAAGAFKLHQYILMHSVLYRTEVLRAAALELPKHTFYVDNIYVYVPLPSVSSLYYLNVDWYRYFIGREGQSVNEKTMVSRIDQQLRVTRIMIDAFELEKDVESLPLRAYMTNYLTMMMTISSVFLLLSKREDAEQQRTELWDYLKEKNPGVYPRMRNGALGRGVTLKGPVGRTLTIAGYRIAQKIFKFN
ncbi:MAG: glycosyltransferase [Coriobacteriia bacterium]|nr:glycosyltransferase [Coriobacteriia bacterium]